MEKHLSFEQMLYLAQGDARNGIQELIDISSHLCKCDLCKSIYKKIEASQLLFEKSVQFLGNIPENKKNCGLYVLTIDTIFLIAAMLGCKEIIGLDNPYNQYKLEDGGTLKRVYSSLIDSKFIKSIALNEIEIDLSIKVAVETIAGCEGFAIIKKENVGSQSSTIRLYVTKTMCVALFELKNERHAVALIENADKLRSLIFENSFEQSFSVDRSETLCTLPLDVFNEIKEKLDGFDKSSADELIQIHCKNENGRSLLRKLFSHQCNCYSIVSWDRHVSHAEKIASAIAVSDGSSTFTITRSANNCAEFKEASEMSDLDAIDFANELLCDIYDGGK